MDVNKIQKIINDRAEARLDKDINELCTPIYRNKLIIDTTSKRNYPVVYQAIPGSEATNYKAISLQDIFSTGREIMEELKAYWLPQYIEEETKLFVQEIDGLKTKVAELQEQVDNIQ